MKKSIVLFSIITAVFTLSGCCCFKTPPKIEAPIPVVIPAPAIPADSDKDGVIDADDQCPATPAGVRVNVKGCPLDSDKDGVIDDIDQCPNTKAGLAVDSKGCPPPIEENVKIAIGVLFATGKADITPDSTEDINKLGAFMQTYPGTTTVLEGNTDNIGSEEMNHDLSKRRADAVRAYLIENYGIAPNRLKTAGYGFSRPVADNSTEDGRKLNRRTEAAINVFVIKPQ